MGKQQLRFRAAPRPHAGASWVPDDCRHAAGGWQQNGAGFHSQDPGRIHLLLVPSVQDLVQYPACPACRPSLICYLAWSTVGPGGKVQWAPKIGHSPPELCGGAQAVLRGQYAWLPPSPFPPCAYSFLVPLRTIGPRPLCRALGACPLSVEERTGEFLVWATWLGSSLTLQNRTAS